MELFSFFLQSLSLEAAPWNEILALPLPSCVTRSHYIYGSFGSLSCRIGYNTHIVLTKWQLSLSTSSEGQQRQVSPISACPPGPSTACFLRDRVIRTIPPSCDEGYLLLCVLTLLGERLATETQGFICKFRGTKINSITIPLSATCSILSPQTQDLCGVSVTGDWLPTLSLPLGRRAELPRLPSPIVQDHPVKRAGKLPRSRQAKAGPDYPASIPATEATDPKHLTVGLSPGAAVALTMAGHQWCQGRAAGDCFEGLHVGRAIRLQRVAITQQILI